LQLPQLLQLPQQGITAMGKSTSRYCERCDGLMVLNLQYSQQFWQNTIVLCGVQNRLRHICYKSISAVRLSAGQ